MMRQNGSTLIIWLGIWSVTAGIGLWLGTSWFSQDTRVFLPGPTTHGHHQIELQCSACHQPDGGVSDQACINCHQDYLDSVKDTHPKKKFRDVRKAHLMETIDALNCITCHEEHVADRTHAMGVSVQTDFCFHCHQDIGEERPTHKNLDHKSCATAGCHNYHDNTALYYDFLKRHAEDPTHADDPRVPARDYGTRWHARNPDTTAATVADGPSDSNPQLVAAWHASAHATAGITCTDCHAPAGAAWSDQVPQTTCASCHQGETDGWLASKHGMRIASDLPPMTPAQAIRPMHQDAHHRMLDCNSCHDPHAVDTRFAAVQACLQCHNDDHSNAYLDSPHHATWLKEITGKAPAGSGISCATCHMPRVESTVDGGKTVVHVEHNVNRYLQPNEGMIRTSCQHCHSVGHAIDALADPDLIRRNFDTSPDIHIESIEWVLEHMVHTSR